MTDRGRGHRVATETFLGHQRRVTPQHKQLDTLAGQVFKCLVLQKEIDDLKEQLGMRNQGQRAAGS